MSEEERVGPFRADILCKDADTEKFVLIENQLERTDHAHLVQLTTYAAGLDAVTAIWIAGKFTEEHRAALDWLNRITEEGVNFFGIEIELYRIGDSPAAPRFNIVCQPNDWSKDVKETARAARHTPAQEMHRAYWQAFKAYLEENQSVLNPKKPLPQNWTTFAIGRSGFKLTAYANTREQCVGAHLTIQSDNAADYFFALKEQWETASRAEIDPALEWREKPNHKECHVGLQLPGDPANQEDWPRQHEWLADRLEKRYRFFKPKIRDL